MIFFHFLPKNHVFGHFRIFLDRNQKNTFWWTLSQFYCCHFKLLTTSLPQMNSSCSPFLVWRARLYKSVGSGGGWGQKMRKEDCGELRNARIMGDTLKFRKNFVLGEHQKKFFSKKIFWPPNLQKTCFLEKKSGKCMSFRARLR